MMIILIVFGVIALLVVVLSNFMKKINAMCKSKKRLDGRTAIITGGTTGIGLEIAVDFARRGARVIVASPFKEEGNQAIQVIKRRTGNEKVTFKYLDLSSLKCVREFCEDILKNEDRLDILVNNAGVGIPGDFLTTDGMHYIMQVNYYGHFLLTLLLLPLLKKSGTEHEKSRIVNTTSMTRHLGSLNVDNYDRIGYWTTFRVYANSKLCLALFSRELAKRIDGNCVINNADPGLVATRIYDSCHVVIGYIVRIFLNAFFKNPLEGAQIAIHIALDESAGNVSGETYVNCELVNKKWSDREDSAAARLWDRSVQLVKLDQELELVNK